MDQGEEDIYDDGDGVEVAEGDGEEAGFDEDELDSALADAQGQLCRIFMASLLLLILFCFGQAALAATNRQESSGCKLEGRREPQVGSPIFASRAVVWWLHVSF
jgi:hypothetical protein